MISQFQMIILISTYNSHNFHQMLRQQVCSENAGARLKIMTIISATEPSLAAIVIVATRSLAHLRLKLETKT